MVRWPSNGRDPTVAMPRLRRTYDLGRSNPRKLYFQPPNVAVKVLRRGTAEGPDEHVIERVERVHVLNVIAACDDTLAGLAADYEMLNAARRGNVRVSIGAVRAEHRISRHQRRHGTLQGYALAIRQTPKKARYATVSNGENWELPLRETPHHLQPLRREVFPSGTWRRWETLRIGKVPDPFPRTLPRLSLVGLISLNDSREARRTTAAGDREYQYPPAPDRVFVEPEVFRELPH